MSRPRSPVAIRVVSDLPPATGKSSPPLDDAALVAAIRDGDESAATAFHHRLRGRVDATVRRILGGRDVDHDDLVQLSMIELITSIERFRGDSTLDAWASAITAHIVFNHLRRRKLERRLFSSAEPFSEPPASQSLARKLVARDSVRHIRSLLDEMDPDKAWAFLLHDVCGFDLREIAKITSVTVAAAQRRLVRGRNELHARLAADPDLVNILQDMEAGT